jgi:hypothetical protein
VQGATRGGHARIKLELGERGGRVRQAVAHDGEIQRAVTVEENGGAERGGGNEG